MRLSASMLRILILFFFPRLFPAALSSEVTSYAKISRNGQLARNLPDSSSWFARNLARNDTSADNGNARGISDIVITVSPVYISPRTAKLKKGEAMDYPGASRYSTLDREMIAKLDATAGRKQLPIQQRFHPPAVFDSNVAAQANGKPLKGMSGMSNSESSSNMNSSPFLGPIFSGVYEYSPPGFLDDKPASKPTSLGAEKYPPVLTDDKVPNSYKPSSSDFHAGDDQRETDYPGFDVPPTSYESDGPTIAGPTKHAGHHEEPPFPFAQDPYGHHDHHHHDFHHDVIYDDVPEYYEHHHEHTTEEPETNDQRLDKRPYSYYFIGKKLWYIPLYFSIYFIIYIAALVLKSVARHKINFPGHLAEAATSRSERSEPNEGWRSVAESILEGMERFAEASAKSSRANF